MTHLSPQITHLVSARPMSVTMGNAIRQLKLEISGSDIDMIEQDVGFIFTSIILCSRINDSRRKMHCARKLTIIFEIELLLQMR